MYSDGSDGASPALPPEPTHKMTIDITSEQQTLLERAAQSSGMSVESFVLRAAIQSAHRLFDPALSSV